MSKRAIIGQILRNARRDAGLSERQLGERMHHSHSSISEWETGKLLVHPYVVIDYEHGLELPEGSLLGRIEEAIGGKLDGALKRPEPLDVELERQSPWDSGIMRRYASVLYDLTHEEPGNFTEITKYIYFIAEDDQDLVIEEHITTVPGDEPMRWRHFDPGVLSGSGSLVSFEDLQVQAWCSWSHQIEVLPVKVTARRVRLVAFFLPPVSRRTLNWSVQYNWRGLWNPLRTQGRDNGRIDFRSFTTRGEIILVPPRPEMSLVFVERSPKVGEINDHSWTRGTDVLHGLQWAIDDPPDESLNFTVALQDRPTSSGPRES